MRSFENNVAIAAFIAIANYSQHILLDRQDTALCDSRRTIQRAWLVYEKWRKNKGRSGDPLTDKGGHTVTPFYGPRGDVRWPENLGKAIQRRIDIVPRPAQKQVERGIIMFGPAMDRHM